MKKYLIIWQGEVHTRKAVGFGILTTKITNNNKRNYEWSQSNLNLRKITLENNSCIATAVQQLSISTKKPYQNGP